MPPRRGAPVRRERARARSGPRGLAGGGKWLLLSLGIAADGWLLHGPGRILERSLALAWHEGHHSIICPARCGALLLLDEPAASPDAATESSLYTNRFAAFADACVVSSVHRLNLLSRFDEVIVVEDGRIVAHGPPAAIVADGGGTGIAADAPREASAAY